MIAFIVGLVILVTGIVLSIIFYKELGSVIAGIIAACFVLFIIIICISHSEAQATSTKIENVERIDELLNSKHTIIRNIDDEEITSDNLDDIIKHNEDVDRSNNYWCRFKLEDRSDFMIDYNYYFNLYKEQYESKLNVGSVIDNEPEYTIYYPDEEYWNSARSKA